MAIDYLTSSDFTDKIITRFDPFQGVERLLNLALRDNRSDPHGETML